MEKLEFWNPKNLKSKNLKFQISKSLSSLRSAFQDLDSETDQRSFVRTSFTIWKIIFYLKSWIPYLLCNVRQKRKGAQGLIVRKQSKDIQIITRRPRDFYWIKFQSQAVNTQGKEAFAKELPMENKGMRFQKLFFLTFLWTYLPLRIYSLSFPLPRSLTICWKKLTRDPRIIEIKRRWKRKSSVDPKGTNVGEPRKGNLTVCKSSKLELENQVLEEIISSAFS